MKTKSNGTNLPATLDKACFWLADGVMMQVKYRNENWDWRLGFAFGRASTALSIVKEGINPGNRKAVGRRIRDTAAWLKALQSEAAK